MLDKKAVERIKSYIEDNFAEDFEYSVESRRGEMLEFLESLMDLGDLADAKATEVIFKGQLGALAGIPTENKNS